MTLTPEQVALLRKPFDRKTMGVLPKPYKADSPKGRCPECKGFHGMPAAHLDYVGHAAVTDRLLAVDPGWTWEPMAQTPDGLPLGDSAGNLWIRLTVGGVTRIGVGDGKSHKERIGDAIRNAAMRFGVALDLWSKDELEGVDAHVSRPTDDVAPAVSPAPTPAPMATLDEVIAADAARDWRAEVKSATGVDRLRGLWAEAKAAGALDGALNSLILGLVNDITPPAVDEDGVLAVRSSQAATNEDVTA